MLHLSFRAAALLLFCLVFRQFSVSAEGNQHPGKERGSSPGRYDPTWESLDKRPNPTWFDEAKFGIFLHWGVFSVPALVNEWFWEAWKGGNKEAVDFMEKNFPPDYTYQDFGRDFHASFFDPYAWTKIFEEAGAKYIVLTSKHHEGYTMWPSKYSFSWNAMDVGPGRDLVGELAAAVRNSSKLHFGLYHSMFEWFHPLYLEDKANGYHTRHFPEAKALPELYEIVNAYRPDVIWSDGEWEASSDYWNSTGFISWLYNDSPVKDTVVTNDRWGNDTRCKHGGFLTCEDSFDPGQLIPKKWENCLTVDSHSWGYRRNMDIADIRSAQELIRALARAVSCGGNLLLNVGPTADGKIAAVFQERLRQIGSWLDVNGEAIYSTRPWIYQNDTVNSDVWYSCSKDNSTVYAIYLRASGANITLGAPTFSKQTSVQVFGSDKFLKWTTDVKGHIVVKLPPRHELPDPAAWSVVLQLTNLKNKPTENPFKITAGTRPEVASLWRNEKFAKN
ncbi:Plasma alpha-L-fucosidase [Hypsibius exemplaris]|uniref:Putative alpha-L-fucosidase n=1 Tax=Hypsibius exemplaris TaxID=2072580 RepID=A0A1W0WMN9_HYPEX|nr:Plasma alpha-L-fucosidase [Hypsibius exemplaris]